MIDRPGDVVSGGRGVKNHNLDLRNYSSPPRPRISASPHRASSHILQLLLVAVFTTFVALGLITVSAMAQSRHRLSTRSICGNPQLPCKTSVTFEPHDLPFRVPKNAVIYDTEQFYAIVLKSVGQSENDCDFFVPENERLAAQALFPRNKVFTSRCPDPPDEMLFYTNVSSKHRIMAVYAGKTFAEATRLINAVKATGKFPGASIRRMRTGFNGT